jgi:hypothetical protein
MPRPRKLGDPRGVAEWQSLETVADIRRFFRWCVLSVRSQTLDKGTAAVLTQLGLGLLRTVETGTLRDRVARLEGDLSELGTANSETGRAAWADAQHADGHPGGIAH